MMKTSKIGHKRHMILMTRATSANEVTIADNRHAGNHNLLVMYFEFFSGWGR